MIIFSIANANKLNNNLEINLNQVVEQLCRFLSKKLVLKSEKFFDINIVNSKKIQMINKKFRNINKPTDVISFAFCDNKEITTPLLGEIFICYDIAKQQANEFNHSFEREIIFLITHGLLHLLGYDHENKKNEQKMLKLTKEIINNIDIDLKYKKG